MTEIVNKVANSKIFTLDMEQFLPKKESILTFDLKGYLFQGIVLKEKEFRTALKEFDWSIYENKCVLVTCSTDAILPIWAYMLVTTYLQDTALSVGQTHVSILNDVLRKEVEKQHSEINLQDRPIVIKGCSNIDEKENLYLEATKLLMPYAKNLMYGEPCSTVPIFKRKKK